jgi:hypothetical protein
MGYNYECPVCPQMHWLVCVAAAVLARFGDREDVRVPIQEASLCTIGVPTICSVNPDLGQEACFGNELYYIISHVGIAIRLGCDACITTELQERIAHQGVQFDLPQCTQQLSALPVTSGTANSGNPDWDELARQVHGASGAVYLAAYLQNKEYWQSSWAAIRALMRFTPAVASECAARMSSFRLRHSGPVTSVHVRGGDYISSGYAPDIPFYLSVVRTGGCALIATNDRNWVMQHLLPLLPCAEISTATLKGVDMCLLSKGDHIAVGGGTFGLFGGLMSTSPVAYTPRQFYQGAADWGPQHFYPDHWTMPTWRPFGTCRTTHSRWCTPTGLAPAEPPTTDYCASLPRGTKLLFAGDSFVRHAFQGALILLRRDYEYGGLNGTQEGCQYNAQFKEKKCWFSILGSDGTGCVQTACAGNVTVRLKYDGAATVSAEDMATFDVVYWSVASHGWDGNGHGMNDAGMIADKVLTPMCSRAGTRDGTHRAKLVYMDIHAQGRWFIPCAASQPGWDRERTDTRCAKPRETREVVTTFHEEMPSLACRICGMCTSVSLFDWTLALGESAKTDWQDMTWDGMHWQMPVNLWKSHYALSIAHFAVAPLKILVGVFGTDRDSAREDRFSRWLPMSTGPDGMQFIFVHGQGQEDRKWTVKLNVPENMNEGKSPAWFRWAAAHSDADYVFKMDLDTAVCPEGILGIVREAHARGADYIGHIHTLASCGGYPHCPRPGGWWTYMSGAFYGLSRRAYTQLPPASSNDTGYEDIAMGKLVHQGRANARLFDISCMYTRSPAGINGAAVPGCPIQHMQTEKDAASKGPLC